MNLRPDKKVYKYNEDGDVYDAAKKAKKKGKWCKKTSKEVVEDLLK